MRTTERKHWRNGYTIHGGYFKQWAFTLGRFGVIVANGRPFVSVYRFKPERERERAR